MTLLLTLLLLVATVLAGRSKSEKIIVTLLANTAILFVAVVLMLMGFHAIVIGWLCFIGVSVLTLFYQNGVNRKTVSAFLSLLIVVTALSFLVWFLCVRAGLYGANERNWEEDEIVMLDLHLHINMVRVTYVAIILGLLGAAKDSAMAVATGAYEVFSSHPDMSRRELFQSGMNIGRDILGVTINTLLFAAIGQSLLLCQMYFDCTYTFSQLINAKSLFQAAAAVLVGGLGVEASIPITAAILSFLCAGKPGFPAKKSNPAETP